VTPPPTAAVAVAAVRLALAWLATTELCACVLVRTVPSYTPLHRHRIDDCCCCCCCCCCGRIPVCICVCLFAYSLDSNLAVVIKSDGSLIGMGRSALYKAVNWRDPTTYSFHPTQGAGGEVSLSNNEFRSENTTWMDAFVRAMLPAETALCAAAWHCAWRLQDPFIYYDNRTPPVLHMLRHTGRDTQQTKPNATRGSGCSSSSR
jgi:hypothetical protein